MKKIGEIFDSLSNRNEVFKELRFRIALSDLSSFLGESLARHCRFVEVHDGKVYFECDDPMWLTEANFMRKKLKEKIKQIFPDQQIVDVIFRRCKQCQ